AVGLLVLGNRVTSSQDVRSSGGAVRAGGPPCRNVVTSGGRYVDRPGCGIAYGFRGTELVVGAILIRGRRAGGPVGRCCRGVVYDCGSDRRRWVALRHIVCPVPVGAGISVGGT